VAERPGPKVHSIAAHRGFADALVAGLIPRYAEPDLGLARLTLLLPSRRAERIVTEAFVRLSQGGLLLPRMVLVGDLDLDETLGALLDPLGTASEIASAADPVRRWLRLADHIAAVRGESERGAALLRQAFEFGRTIDRLLVEEVDPLSLAADEVHAIVSELAGHWDRSTAEFRAVYALWSAELAERGEIDAPERRNRLFDHTARRWKESPPAFPVVAAGVTSASPALARLLRVVADLPKGSVILPDLDLALDAEVWDELGTAGMPPALGDPPFGSNDAATHPQYHLKLLLGRMGVARGEVQPWHRAGLAAAEPARSRAISNLFLPPRASARWAQLPAEERRLTGVRMIEAAHPGEEAQAIALLIREALEVPEKRVALVTPDRGLAGRVVAHLGRWGIAADDTAGRPLPQTAAGRLFLLLAEVLAEQAAPVPLIALLGHPKVRSGEERAEWLDRTRALDLALRGPRPDAGLEPLRAIAATHGLAEWWAGVEPILAPLFALGDEVRLADGLDALAAAGEALCGVALWEGADGRALSAWFSELRRAADQTGTRLAPGELAPALRDALDRVQVRPPWGGHPRVAIYGLLEARMARADLAICGGLIEGTWPGSSAPDPLLPPAVLRALGVPGAEFRIGLAAHDLAAALGAPEVVLSWSQRAEGAPALPSRFVLRIKAMLGDQLDRHVELDKVRQARLLGMAKSAPPYPRPKPMPDAEQRRVDVSVTGLDRLRGDPYQFYANSILRLKSLDGLDMEPSAAWQGSAVHDILETWHRDGGELIPLATTMLDAMSAHPLMRALWRPRLLEALRWLEAEQAKLGGEGRRVLKSEVWGETRVKGVRIFGRADRIDQLPAGTLAVIDYKTGKPPTGAMVEQGFALQLGLTALIAECGGFDGVSGAAERFEYWSLAKRRSGEDFGFIEEPVLEGRKRSGLPRDEFVATTAAFLDDALDRWILGSDPFTARLNPDLASYNDFDQLMRLDEWLPNLTPEEANEA
jgi:ATP-dependent helicase/nuclease subunit B